MDSRFLKFSVGFLIFSILVGLIFFISELLHYTLGTKVPQFPTTNQKQTVP